MSYVTPIRHLSSLIGLIAPLIAFAQLDMVCYERCRSTNNEAMYCQNTCTRHQQPDFKEDERLVPPMNEGYKPSGALGAIYHGEAQARQQQNQQQQILNMILQNELLRLQAEKIRRERENAHNTVTATDSLDECTTDSQCVRGYSCRTKPNSGGIRYCTLSSGASNRYDCKVDSDCTTGSCRSKRGGGTECR